MNPIQRTYRRRLKRVMATRQIEDLTRAAIVFAPHPDDETLGCGGTIIRKKAAGADVKVVFLTNGSRSHAALMPEDKLSQIRQTEALQAGRALGLGAEDITFLGFDDGRLSQFKLEAKAHVRRLLMRHSTPHSPLEIFVPYALEPPPDHAVTYEIVVATLNELNEQLGYQYVVYAYPIWYWQHWPWMGIGGQSKRETLRIAQASLAGRSGNALLEDFRHSVYVGDVLEQKWKALNQHASQMKRLQPNWPILKDVAKGDFLDCFFQDYEIFHNPYESR